MCGTESPQANIRPPHGDALLSSPVTTITFGHERTNPHTPHPAPAANPRLLHIRRDNINIQSIMLDTTHKF